MRTLILSGVLLSTLAFPAVALADQDHGRHKGHGQAQGHEHMEKLFDRLNLTPEQKSKIQAIRQRHREAAKADREAIREKRQALAKLMWAEQANQAQAMALHREIQAIETRLSEARLASWFEVRQVLTPAQLKQLAEMKGERRRGKGRQ